MGMGHHELKVGIRDRKHCNIKNTKNKEIQTKRYFQKLLNGFFYLHASW